MAAADELQARVNFSALSLGQDTFTPAPAQDDQSPLTLSGLQNVPSRNSVDSAATTARESVLFIGSYFNLYTAVDTLPRGEFKTGEGEGGREEADNGQGPRLWAF